MCVYLVLACAVHSALDKTEGAADFVFLRIRLRGDNVSVPLFLFNSENAFSLFKHSSRVKENMVFTYLGTELYQAGFNGEQGLA